MSYIHYHISKLSVLLLIIMY